MLAWVNTCNLCDPLLLGQVPPHLRTLHVSHEPYLLDMPLTDNLVSARLLSFPLPRGAKRWLDTLTGQWATGQRLPTFQNKN